jgi:hypothetical protein
MNIRKNILSVTAGLMVAAVSSSASAAVISFTTSVGTQPGNVGTITLTDINATTVRVLVDLLPGYGFLNTGGPHTPFAFNLANESGVTASFLSPVGGTFASGAFSLNLSGGDNTPYGTFGVAIDSSAGNGSGNGYFGDLSFDVMRAGGITVNSFVANADGYFFSADLSDNPQNGNTGAQGWKIPVTTQVPEPLTLALLGLGLVGMGAARRKRNS